MKTLFTLTALLIFSSSVLLYGKNIGGEGLKKDTLAISTKSINRSILSDEEYIDDIPFDTKLVAVTSLFKNLNKPESENYINDIPFNTEENASYFFYAMHKILVEDEDYIDDIPFDTLDIAITYQGDSNTDFAFDLEKRKCDD